MKPNGYVIHETDHIVVISTGHVRVSKNVKTGDMLQIWILTKNVDPLQAIRQKIDGLICGDCKLGPAAPQGKRSCYVSVKNAPLAVWRAWTRGNYPRITFSELAAKFAGRAVRFGAYGDPVRIPATIVKEIARVAKNWTGYTHQWRNPLLSGFRHYLMASVDSLTEQAEAASKGWRTFRVAETVKTLAREVECPAYTRGVKCADCGLCKGAISKAKSIVIAVHGFQKGNFAEATNA